MCHPNAGALCLGAPHRLLMSHLKYRIIPSWGIRLIHEETIANVLHAKYRLAVPELNTRTPPSSLHKGNPEDYQGLPALYIHPGIPYDSEESPVGSEEIEGVHEEIPALPLTAIHEGHEGLLVAGLSPEFVEILTTAWPELAAMLSWWRRGVSSSGTDFHAKGS
jgi:hypothetical protein